jgi:hypothetical protein
VEFGGVDYGRVWQKVKRNGINLLEADYGSMD